MKSLKIQALGLAALGVLAAPFAASGTEGVLEQGTWTDRLNVTVAPTCTFTRNQTGANHTNGANYALNGIHNTGNNSNDLGAGTPVATGTWSTNSTTPYVDTLAGTLMGDSIQENFGNSTFRVICNDHNGWQVTTNVTDLIGQSVDTEKIVLGQIKEGEAKWQYSASTDDATYVTVASGSLTSNTTVAQNGEKPTTGNDGVTFTVQYGVSTDNVISAQTYSGTIEYIFAQKNAPAEPGA